MDILVGRLYVNKRGEIATIFKTAFRGGKIYYYYLDDPDSVMWLQKKDFVNLFNVCEDEGCL